jgi:pyridoxamine 5'-phosphate oxidase
MDPDPIVQFQRWFRAARRVGLFQPDAMTLATAGPDGTPSARMMLLKGVDEKGFVFYTNYESRKGRELSANPSAALAFHWNELMRQVRVEGRVAKTSQKTSSAYFRTRPRGSRLGAWASRQSTVIADRALLLAETKRLREQHRDHEVPLPPFWGGYILRPESLEFWQGRPDRLHDRLRYRREGESWVIERLAP